LVLLPGFLIQNTFRISTSSQKETCSFEIHLQPSKNWPILKTRKLCFSIFQIKAVLNIWKIYWSNCWAWPTEVVRPLQQYRPPGFNERNPPSKRPKRSSARADLNPDPTTHLVATGTAHDLTPPTFSPPPPRARPPYPCEGSTPRRSPTSLLHILASPRSASSACSFGLRRTGRHQRRRATLSCIVGVAVPCALHHNRGVPHP
jgi:hypothetical protein